MHMADALISPAVGGTMWVATAGLVAYCSRKTKTEMDQGKAALMGVTSAFVFAAQMINFTIPITGSSGHLGGGLILAVLLGPHAAFLAIASVLTIQALFFADGGLLALGCNIFNMGFFPAFIAYPFIYRPIAATATKRGRILAASLLASVVALQLGAFSVVLETRLSGISELSFLPFLALMQPIHLAIGVVEGAATAAIVLFVRKTRPEILRNAEEGKSLSGVALRRTLVSLTIAAVAVGAVLSWFASTHPDGLEWSIFKTTGREEVEGNRGAAHGTLAAVQEKSAVLPDYSFKHRQEQSASGEEAETWPAPDAGTTVSGLVGAALTLALASLIGLVLKARVKTAR